jgi:Fe2+ transport system protein B
MLPVLLVVVMNMIDIAERHGIHIETHVLAVALGLLEDVGYMVCSAYATDRFMYWMRLHGSLFCHYF